MNRRKRICVIFTGGTIGSASKDGVVGLHSESRAALIDEYKRATRSDIIFEEYRPVELLSENMRSADLERMIDCVRSVDFDGCDGVIITHGTDTLNFTANYFSLIFADAPKPIVFVSALFPLSDPRSNGHANFDGAVTFIMHANYGGVFVSFTEQGEPCKIHLASRLTACQPLTGAYNSLLGVNFGTVRERAFIPNDDPHSPTEERLRTDKRVPAPAGLCADVVTIRARALLDFSYYDLSARKPKAVIVEPYHSGTVCTVGDQTSFIGFRDRCLRSGIPVVVSPIESGANVYESAVGLYDDCYVDFDTSFDMTTVKVMNALCSNRNLREALAENIFYEKISFR